MIKTRPRQTNPTDSRKIGVRHRLFWEPPVGDKDTALLLDCIDFRHFGWIDKNTNKRTKATADFQVYEISAYREGGEAWKVSKVNVSRDKCSF
ncbi:hypothetical protein HKD39_18515 [Nakamurella sp. DB0629]|uniref:Uncharacterized protein n=2 Tax=Nakamurella aerolata TaxID=1656892 RepID=A0A849ALG3_9ACTN|nr:hypothetical protein [Nakamurella aerolata]